MSHVHSYTGERVTTIADSLLVTMMEQQATDPIPHLASSSNITDINLSDITMTTVMDDLQADDMMVKFLYGHAALLSIGVVVNAGTVMGLIQHSEGFTAIVRMLLIHQSVADGLVCSLGIVQRFQPEMWVTKIWFLDLLICHTWHNFAILYHWVNISIHNLIGIALERWLAIRFPFLHMNFTQRHVWIALALVHIVNIIFLIITFFEVRFEDGWCTYVDLKTYLGHSLVLTYDWAILVIYYLAPTFILIGLYGSIIRTFRHRQAQSTLGSSVLIQKASANFTKAAIVVSTIFILTMGFDPIYFVLGDMAPDLEDYHLNAPFHLTALFFGALNSTANPFIYALLMPNFRQSIRLTYFPCRSRVTASSTHGSSSVKAA